MVCLDTDIIINFLRKESSSVQFISQLIENEEEVLTTSINVFELWKGAYKSNKKEAYKAVKEFLSKCRILYLDENSSQKAAKIFQELTSKGDIIDALDIMIASITITNKESLRTNNKKHFDRIKELKLV